MIKKIIRDRGSVYATEDVWTLLMDKVKEIAPSKIFVLTDSNTKTACLPYFLNRFNTHHEPELLTIPAGESHKNITTCNDLWKALSACGADRKSLLINLGGGVVTDLGGFVASTYQRGIDFINIPTSLLAMVDASVGGKNGVDLGVLKNQIGIIRDARVIVIDPKFLDTLPKAHFTSGVAEMIKHGFIHSMDYLERVMDLDAGNTKQLSDLIWESILIKNEIITEDPTEKGIRKTLNYGHTLGHAIESFCLDNSERNTLLHGEAIAIGMILATFISSETYAFPKQILEQTTSHLLKTFGKESFSETEIEGIIKLLIFDKKNTNGQIQFVLLEGIGKPKLNCIVLNELIYSAFQYYLNFHL